MSRVFERNLTLKIVSVILAVMLWRMTPANKNPYHTKQFTDIPLTVEAEEHLGKNGLVLAERPPDTITIEVSGYYSDIKKLDKENLKAVIDLSTVKEPNQTYPVPIRIENLGNLKLEQTQLFLDVDKIISKSIPVELSLEEGEMKELGKHYSVVEPEYIKVTGAESLVERIVKGNVSPNLKETQEVFEGAFPVILLDENGSELINKNISMEPGFCTVRVFPYKTFNVEPTVTGKPAEGYVVMGMEVRPGTIAVSGSPDILNSIKTIGTEILNIEGASQDVQRSLSLQEYEGIKLSPGESSQVQVLVRVEPVISKQFEIEDVEIRNLPEGRKAEISDGAGITVTMQGPRSFIEEFDQEALNAYVDLSGARKGDRNYTVVIDNIPEELSLISNEPIQVSVSVN